MFSKATTISSLVYLATAVLATYDAKANSNMVLYYGQNSAGGDNTQKRLKEYCKTDDVDVVLMSFMHVFPNDPQVNFGPACEDGTTISGTQLLQCPQISEDIKYCQESGKKVILSLGGASGAYSLSSDSEGSDFADQLWGMFGPASGGDSGSNSSAPRPFKDTVLDGFDLDIEGGATTGYAAMVDKLREHFKEDSSKDYLITAAPQCPTNPPDVLTDTIINADIDHLYVQFYNNACGIDTYKKGQDTAFNFGEWDDLVKNKAKNKNAKIFLGVPASQSAAGRGYVDAATVIEAANEMQDKYCSFGGVMAWDMSQAWANTDSSGKNFAEAVKDGIMGHEGKSC